MPGEYSQEALEAHFNAINGRMRKIEAQLMALSKSTGVPYEDPNAEVPEEVKQLAMEGKTMDAARAYRKATGAGLERAMEVVAGI